MLSFRNFLTIIEDNINFNDYNLEQKFQHYNRLLFDNKIPPCPVTWAYLSGMSGVCRFRYIKQTGYMTPGSLSIEISTKFKRSEQTLDETLIHEMIHAYLAVTGHPDANHGRWFQMWASLCGKKSGLTISLTDDIRDAELTADEPIMTTVLLSKKKNKWLAKFYSATAFDSPQKMNELVAYWAAPSNRLSDTDGISIYKVLTSLSIKYGMAKAIKQFDFFMITDHEAQKILQHGKCIRTITPNSATFEFANEHLPTKDVLVIFKTDQSGAVTGTFLTASITKDPVKMQRLFNRHEITYGKVEIFTTKTNVFNHHNYVTFRDVDRCGYYTLPPDVVNELRKNAQYIKIFDGRWGAPGAHKPLW